MARVQQADIRHKILEAASERLWHYGFKKTTIDEIAADAGVGKGTVYLYFDSKEDIALTIVAQFKETSLGKMQGVVQNSEMTPAEKLKEMLILPMVDTHHICTQSPHTQEMVAAVRPHMQARMRPYIEQERELIAEVLEEGNRKGVFDVPDTATAARSLKYMVAGFWPPFPCVTELEEKKHEMGLIVDLVVRGLRKR
ncbi:transcriptional regulator [Capsulimonas corticalis]|uniref:Transcriptional regulator n=1 Tax=Capsulimonas corticalis TaxID=2219043 RepID=A0A402D3Q6_9BACT|nr:TetR/AcrR family transcriptional regulator [Capsulimonas corticalis]BDI31895.1 transcriptional regulator [Capsulimonas corticalis]